MHAPQPDAVVIGRIGADLYPLQSNTALEDVRTFERFVGGFAGNVATGLARLGVQTAIVSAVGDDGHGRFIRRFLADEGVDLRWLGTHPLLRTALAFCEAWPPDHFPITFYREPTCPDWELAADDLPRAALAAAPLAYVTGTGLAREPSRATTLAALELRPHGATRHWTVFDLDWRAQLWHDADDYPPLAERAARASTVLIGGEAEYGAAAIDPRAATSRLGVQVAVVKHGPHGVSLLTADGEEQVPGLPVPVVNGLGAGDAFAAAFGAALLSGLSPAESARRGNAAGAIVATRLACAPAMPSSAEIDRLLTEGRIAADDVETAAPRR
jgi:5-dehydro-2-deoxygluconokinase